MKSLEGIVNANIDAVLREYEEAIDNKNTELALKILRANPDLFGEEVKHETSRAH